MSTPSNSPLMISVSGVRGLIGSSLSPTVAMEFGQAFGHYLKHMTPRGPAVEDRFKVAIGRDSRPSGPMVFSAVAAGLLSVGVDVIDLGVATTPSIALMGRYLKTDASIVITASHNPIIWNGIKFLRFDGVAYPPAEAARIKQTYFDKPWKLEPIDTLGRFSTDSRVHAQHIKVIMGCLDDKAIAEHRYRVVLDSVNGAGCIATPMLLGKLGAEMVHINGEATGIFAHTPEPTRENLTGLCEEVRKKRAAVGFAQDPDADRLAIVDENGTYIGEEYTLALGAYARMLSKPGPAVANLSTSRMIDDIAAKFGQKVYRTPVGEANVAAKMIEVNAIVGGEGNGGIIDLRIGPVRDSLYGIALTLELMHRTGKSISQLVADLPKYSIVKTKFECTLKESAALVKKVQEVFKDQRLDLQDGVRIDWPEGWVHVRQSNTEPIARIIAEAKEESTARELIARVEQLK